MFKAMLIAGAGGFIGTCLRYLVGKLAHYVFSSPFPWGTFAVNIIGSFVIGIFFGMAEKAHLISANMNVFLITGFCGGFTTFSYLVLSIVLGIVLVWLGRSVVKPA